MIKAVTFYSIFALCILISLGESQLFPTFDEYVVQFGKVYDDPDEYSNRKQIYEKKVLQLQKITEYHAAVNKFTDETAEQRAERKKLNELSSISNNVERPIKVSKTVQVGAPASLNWNQKGKVTSIKDQGSCGSCWSFAAAAYGQSKLIIQNRQDKSIDLSEQYLLSCTSQSTCNGGFLEYVFEELGSGIPLESDYPYDPYGANSPFICWSSSKVYPGYIPQVGYGLTDNQLQNLLQVGPVAIAVSSEEWENYGNGVFRCKSGASVDHAVLLTGYTQTYWIIKNQWGEDWGQNGYIRISKSRLSDGNCKIGHSAFILSQKNLLVCVWVFICMVLIFI